MRLSSAVVSPEVSMAFCTVCAEEEEYREPIHNHDAREVDARKRPRDVPQGGVIKYEVRRLK